MERLLFPSNPAAGFFLTVWIATRILLPTSTPAACPSSDGAARKVAPTIPFCMFDQRACNDLRFRCFCGNAAVNSVWISFQGRFRFLSFLRHWSSSAMKPRAKKASCFIVRCLLLGIFSRWRLSIDSVRVWWRQESQLNWSWKTTSSLTITRSRVALARGYSSNLAREDETGCVAMLGLGVGGRWVEDPAPLRARLRRARGWTAYLSSLWLQGPAARGTSLRGCAPRHVWRVWHIRPAAFAGRWARHAVRLLRAAASRVRQRTAVGIVPMSEPAIEWRTTKVGLIVKILDLPQHFDSLDLRFRAARLVSTAESMSMRIFCLIGCRLGLKGSRPAFCLTCGRWGTGQRRVCIGGAFPPQRIRRGPAGKTTKHEHLLLEGRCKLDPRESASPLLYVEASMGPVPPGRGEGAVGSARARTGADTSVVGEGCEFQPRSGRLERAVSSGLVFSGTAGGTPSPALPI